MKPSSILLGFVVLGAGMAPALADKARQPVVVELFTSQGCSSCPPANANLIKLSQRPDVLALSFAVTYWDYLGWKDSFGKPEFTARQEVYEPALGEGGPFTPQMVVDGKASNVGFRLAEVEKLIGAAKRAGSPVIALGPSAATVGAGAAPSGGADVWLVTYDPNVVEVPVSRGENRGATLPHTHVVHSLDRIGIWTGEAQDFALKPAPKGMRTAILVQRSHGGPILASYTN